MPDKDYMVLTEGERGKLRQAITQINDALASPNAAYELQKAEDILRDISRNQFWRDR